jgi:8-oxo-dGTP pyrophosphatase MutT (NUDIX family)
MQGSGTNFATDHDVAGEYSADTPSRGFTQRRRSARSATLLGYLHKDAVVLHVDEARRRRDEDAAAARRRGGKAIAAALEQDIGLWAALSGVDAIWIRRGRYDFDRQYLVGNRAAMLVDEPAPTGAGAPDWTGDGWVDCDCGQRHWGRHGAAGLLLTHRSANGTRWVLMQHRSAANQHAGTWGLLGGARDYRESDERAAMREGWEEARIGPGQYRVTGRYVDDHGSWTYAWVLAEADTLLTPTADHESTELRWVRLDELHTLPLHPGFTAGWPAARAALLGRSSSGRSEQWPRGRQNRIERGEEPNR